MPQCHRCTRTFATADVRRTTKGHVCKDQVACKRRLGETIHPVVDGVFADRLIMAAKEFDSLADGHDPIHALHVIAALGNAMKDCAFDVITRAGKETNLTQKQLAVALGVPPSTLAGLRGGRSRH